MDRIFPLAPTEKHWAEWHYTLLGETLAEIIWHHQQLLATDPDLYAIICDFL